MRVSAKADYALRALIEMGARATVTPARVATRADR